MPDEKSMRRSRPKHVRLRILFLLLFWHCSAASSFVPPPRFTIIIIADLHILNRMPRNSRQNRRNARRRSRIHTGNVAQNDPPNLTHRNACQALASAHPASRKSARLYTSRIVMFVQVTSSTIAPSTLSIASPLHPSNTQFETVMFLNPPFDSVPNLIRPVRPTFSFSAEIASTSHPAAHLPRNSRSPCNC